MKVLVINAGSSSLKYQLIDMTDESVLAKGNCERIGTAEAFIGFKTPDGQKIERQTEMKNHRRLSSTRNTARFLTSPRFPPSATESYRAALTSTAASSSPTR